MVDYDLIQLNAENLLKRGHTAIVHCYMKLYRNASRLAEGVIRSVAHAYCLPAAVVKFVFQFGEQSTEFEPGSVHVKLISLRITSFLELEVGEGWNKIK